MNNNNLVELPSYELDPIRGLAPDAVAAYERDGVVSLRHAFNDTWIELLAEGMEIAIKDGYQRNTAFNIATPGEPGFFFYDTFMWQRIDNFRKFIFDSNVSEVAATIMQSESLIFYFDFMLVKEPGTSNKTPWHYDEAYWPIKGNQICNLWIALDDIPVQTALRFLVGSHLWSESYNPVHFDPTMDYADLPERPRMPDWDKEPGEYELAFSAMEPGDCLVFNSRTFHSAPGNSLKTSRRRALATHWIGDDITYNDKSYETDPPYRGENLVHGGSMECATFPRVR
tara:strand:+ start:5287 stop:6138 length:852 start_codon:yes stop_codon:yes gene_type:complete